MGFEAVIFDLDGTLVDFRFRFMDSKVALLKELASLGFDVTQFTVRDYTQSILEKVAEEIHLRRIPLTYERVKGELSRILDLYELEAASQAELSPNALQVLEELRAGGILLGLVTNNGSRATNFVLTKHDLRKYFDVIVTRDNSTRLKPRGDGLRIALSQLKVAYNKALFVGDSLIDIMAARDAGNLAVATITGGIYPREVLEDMKPDHLIDSLREIPSIVLKE